MENDIYITVFLTMSTLVYSYTSINMQCQVILHYTMHENDLSQSVRQHERIRRERETGYSKCK